MLWEKDVPVMHHIHPLCRCERKCLKSPSSDCHSAPDRFKILYLLARFVTLYFIVMSSGRLCMYKYYCLCIIYLVRVINKIAKKVNPNTPLKLKLKLKLIDRLGLQYYYLYYNIYL